MNITDIVTNIDQRLADLDAELTHLTGARAALIDTAAADRPAAPAKPSPVVKREPRRTRRPTVKQTYEVVPAGKLIALLAAGEDLSTRELARTANADPDQVLVLLKEQEDAGQVSRTGTRAATRWHAITDEDRIAARVIELEAASRRPRARKT